MWGPAHHSGVSRQAPHPGSLRGLCVPVPVTRGRAPRWVHPNPGHRTLRVAPATPGTPSLGPPCLADRAPLWALGVCLAWSCWGWVIRVAFRAPHSLPAPFQAGGLPQLSASSGRSCQHPPQTHTRGGSLPLTLGGRSRPVPRGSPLVYGLCTGSQAALHPVALHRTWVLSTRRGQPGRVTGPPQSSR